MHSATILCTLYIDVRPLPISTIFVSINMSIVALKLVLFRARGMNIASCQVWCYTWPCCGSGHAHCPLGRCGFSHAEKNPGSTSTWYFAPGSLETGLQSGSVKAADTSTTHMRNGGIFMVGTERLEGYLSRLIGACFYVVRLGGLQNSGVR